MNSSFEMSKYTLINVGVNPKPAVPEYYFNIFRNILHICPGSRPGLLRQVGNHEFLLNITGAGYNLNAYFNSIGFLGNSFCIELALQSGVNYHGLIIPPKALLIGRICDIHHLSNPLTSVYRVLNSMRFNCILISSCPHYIPILQEMLPCFYLPTDINLTDWKTCFNKQKWLKRSIRLHLDGSLVSRLHPSRSLIFNRLFAFEYSKIDLPECKALNRAEWFARLGKSQIVVQHGLNGNAHPPFLAALSRGALPLIDRLSSETLSKVLAINLNRFTYDCPSDLINLLQVDSATLFDECDLPVVSEAVRLRIYSNISAWSNHLASASEKSLDSCRAPTQSIIHSCNIYPLDVDHEVLSVLQAFQELMRRLSYLSKGSVPFLCIVASINNENINKDYMEFISYIYDKICSLWPVNLIDMPLDEHCKNSVVSIDVALQAIAYRISKNPFTWIFETQSSILTSRILVKGPLLDNPDRIIL